MNIIELSNRIGFMSKGCKKHSQMEISFVSVGGGLFAVLYGN